MIDEQKILRCIELTMVSDAKLIKDAELQLFEFQKEAGFTTFLLKVVANEEFPIHVRVSSAIYLKNKIQRSWDAKNRLDGIIPDEQLTIKENLIQTLIKNVSSSHLRPHLTESVRAILNCNDNWDLISVINELLSSGNQDYIYPGLLLLFEVCIVHRWDMAGNRQYIDKVINSIFPTVENIASQLVNAEDYKSNELLYLILKCFKYACLNNFPEYFTNVDKLNSWIQLHLFVCAKPLPKQVLDLDISDRSLDKRVKVTKWGFGNLNRFVQKYCRTTKVVTQDFVNYVFMNIVPTILKEYFKIIQLWGTSSLWLSESALYYLIQFLEKCVTTDELYPLISPHLETIIQNVIFPCLCASNRSVELLEDDQEEYTRRYFDLNREGSTEDVASTDFIFVVGHKRPAQMHKVLPFLNEIFNSFLQNSNDLDIAYRQEGAMRTVSTFFSFLEPSSELEGIFSHFIVPLMSQNQYQFLVARALETISLYSHPFQDMATLSKLFEMTFNRFMDSDSIPVQVEAADALKTLIISNPDIHQHISSQVPRIMEKLLKVSKEFEIDTLSEVMEAFVERFADELTPFAEDLAANLTEQFLQIAKSIVDNSSSSYSSADQDQELQASALLQTMTTMVMAMNKVYLVDKFLPVVKFIILHAQISFLTEIVDLMDSLALSSIGMYQQFTPAIWEMFDDVLHSFQTYAMDYFESYQVFFETVVTHGFPRDQSYVQPFLEILSVKLESDIDYDVEGVYDILVLYALSLKDIPLFDKALRASSNDELDLDDSKIIKCFLANLFIKPIETLQVAEREGMTLNLLQKWFNCNLTSVFAIKLQILAIISLFKLPELPSAVSGFVPQFSDKLVTITEKLPLAIRKRDTLAKGEEGIDELFESPEDEEYFEGYEDDLKETVLDQINCFQEVGNFFNQIKQENLAMYEKILGSLNDERENSLQVILEFVAQN
ncbi:hypothetical protein Kpol_345p6 [Vanderwaltozyma polyspora DSM 70294]|uniref:Importin N-terminal domain-containing protein n=1 Tax=Vanderwaltozyma polyspora (strain ATCC 22028 / DSM 70294 / BCRC 21397 / CBS 2163 / NBRC 10782 / NRRL Y-8283 / UCD 57-17) TaxID=436907 RepID=A7TSA1_VANPO|nr:uncharacterized protein Kpol_345p6 [Vanderwaltozyma polyspora DSM 70294]EDO14858.1 hypothetical protein Kpol_345p6 [Vanderwaltozyma polyspora DSM 70294]